MVYHQCNSKMLLLKNAIKYGCITYLPGLQFLSSTDCRATINIQGPGCYLNVMEHSSKFLLCHLRITWVNVEYCDNLKSITFGCGYGVIKLPVDRWVPQFQGTASSPLGCLGHTLADTLRAMSLLGKFNTTGVVYEMYFSSAQSLREAIPQKNLLLFGFSLGPAPRPGRVMVLMCVCVCLCVCLSVPSPILFTCISASLLFLFMRFCYLYF